MAKGLASDTFTKLMQGGLEENTEAPKTVVKPKPLGVLLTFSEQTRLNDIAAELGVSRHSLLVFIVREFIRNYDRGIKPNTTPAGKNTLVSKDS